MALPPSIDFTDANLTEGDFKTAITNQREFLAGLLGTDGTANTALRTLGAFGNDVSARSANYTVIASDRGVVFNCTSTFTLSLTAAATLGDGFTFAVINRGTGIITIDPNSTEQIDGANTKAIAAGSWAIVSCTGTAFISMGSVPSNFTGYNCELFTTSGTSTWVKPQGVSMVKVTVIGGGAGGSNGSGGFGGYAVAEVPVTGDVTVTVGAGGAGKPGGGVPGDAGGTSSFGTAVSATGGAGFTGSVPAIPGIHGSGTVSAGTALVLSTNTRLRIVEKFYTVDRVYKTSGIPAAWSPTTTYDAGAGGSTLNVGGSHGIVFVEW
jgi:hypothetical protein